MALRGTPFALHPHAMRRKALLASLIGLAATSVWAQIPSLQRDIVGRQFNYSVQRGDSLTGIGARLGVSAKALAAKNGIAPSAKLRPGQVLRVDNRHIVPVALEDGIVINLPQRLLFLFEGGRLAAWYPVAVGQPEWQTPTGSYQVVTRERDPVWDVPVSIQQEMRRKGERVRTKVPPGPDNPLGEYWMGLSLSCCGIHSTNAPQSVYQFQTHGCIRLAPEDAEDLFYRIGVGAPVEIIYEPVLLAENPDGTTLLEVHPDVYGRTGSQGERAMEMAESRGLSSGGDSSEWEETLRGEEGIATAISASPDP